MAGSLSIQNLNHVYPNGTTALRDITCMVPSQSFVAIVGHSGSGKSTLLRCINRLEKPTSGSIIWDNQDILKMSFREFRTIRPQMGMVFQSFNLIPGMSVLTNVLTGRLGRWQTQWLGGIFKSWPSQWIQDAMLALEKVKLAEKSHIRVDDLSGGQKQRVAIARTLMQSPKLLLADEPVASLDPVSTRNIMDDLKTLNQEFGMTVLCNLHSIDLVRQYADHVIALKKGEVVCSGPTSLFIDSKFSEIYREK